MVFAKLIFLLKYKSFNENTPNRTGRCSFSYRYQQMMQTMKKSMIPVVESLINKFEEDQMKKGETVQELYHIHPNSQYNDNCSDSDSSFNQVRDNSSHLCFIALIKPPQKTLFVLHLTRVTHSSDRSSCKLWLKNLTPVEPKR